MSKEKTPITDTPIKFHGKNLTLRERMIARYGLNVGLFIMAEKLRLPKEIVDQIAALGHSALVGTTKEAAVLQQPQWLHAMHSAVADTVNRFEARLRVAMELEKARISVAKPCDVEQEAAKAKARGVVVPLTGPDRG